MDNSINPFQSSDGVLDAQSLSTPRAFVANVFSYMSLALIISGVMAWWFGTTDLVYYLIGEGGPTALGWVTMFAPLGFVLAMNFGFNRMSLPVLIGVFLSFAAVMGISLSYIFLIYSLDVIAKVFFITSALFATMAVIGYTTKTDLTRLGSLLMMALIGLIIASLVNYFMESERLDYIISCVGVLIFTGLIAYDTQKVKRIGAGVEYGTATAGKLAIMGATSLYLDFINLFLFLLRIFGRRD